ncbi:MAG: type II toxin-antitoxin system HicB family antitoxin, partial [Alphaproteobacteria bacterium]|nr:type II toxin-antitoxin system HicB family antitoxin [Alphaproteobacteria bacterium]
YKGYYGSLKFSAEDEVFHGKLEFIRDLVTYEADSAIKIKTEFQQAVDDYLEFCTQAGTAPDRPFKGSFNVRPGPELHAQIAQLADAAGVSLNKIVTAALKDYIRAHGK